MQSIGRIEFQSKFNELIDTGQKIYDAMINEIYDMSLAIRRRQLFFIYLKLKNKEKSNTTLLITFPCFKFANTSTRSDQADHYCKRRV